MTWGKRSEQVCDAPMEDAGIWAKLDADRERLEAEFTRQDMEDATRELTHYDDAEGITADMVVAGGRALIGAFDEEGFPRTGTLQSIAIEVFRAMALAGGGCPSVRRGHNPEEIWNSGKAD